MSNIFPDISFWEGQIDFDIMKSKTNYVILKGCQGVTKDKRFEEYRSECQRVGIPIGVYPFYDDRYSPKRQADFFAGLFVDKPKPVEIYCDWENTYGGQFSGIKNVVAFMQEVEKLMGMEMGMYTGYYWFLEHTNALTNFPQLQYLKSRKLWQAWYNDDYSNTHPELVPVPRPWKQREIWQFTDRADGHSYGCTSAELDMNQQNGSISIPVTQRKIVRGETIYMERL